MGSSLDGTGEVRVYETDSGKFRPMEGQHGPVYAVTFSANGKMVASAGFDGLVRLNDAESGKLVKEFSPVPNGAAKVAKNVIALDGKRRDRLPGDGMNPQ